MTQQDREFKKELKAQLKRRPAIQRDTYAEIVRLLELALTQIKATLSGAPSDWEQYYLPQLQQSIRQSLTEFGQQAGAAAANGSNQSWLAGVDLIDKPIQAGGVAITGMIPQVDTGQLTAMRSFLTDKIGGIGVDLMDKINTQLGLTAIGAQSTGQAVTEIERLLDKGGRSRALTILRTELGRAYSAAAQQRMNQASEVLQGLKKQWRRSGKLHSRVNHDYIDGQIQPVDEPFHVGGAKLMHPRDPKGPAKETINCGCESLPWMEHWEVKSPGRKPFSELETGASAHKHDLARASGELPVTLDEFIRSGDKITQSIVDLTTPMTQYTELMRQYRNRVNTGHQLKIANSGIGAQLVKQASTHFPDSWTERTERLGPLNVRSGKGLRGFQYTVPSEYNNARIRLPGFGVKKVRSGDGFIQTRTDNGLRTSIHELAHRIQSALPELDGLFQSLHRRRTEGEPLKRLKDLKPDHHYKPNEVTREDHYIDPYQGKEYDEGALEVLTMAFETVLGVDPDNVRSQELFMMMLKKDREMFNLAVGLLFFYKP